MHRVDGWVKNVMILGERNFWLVYIARQEANSRPAYQTMGIDLPSLVPLLNLLRCGSLIQTLILIPYRITSWLYVDRTFG